MSSLPPPYPETPPGSGGQPQPSPGYVPYQASGYGMVPFSRIGGLAKAMLILLAVWAALQVVLLPVLLAVRGKAVDFVDRKISEDAFEDALTTQQAVQAIQGLVNIAIIVLTMVWLHRMIVNHRALGRPGSTWSPGWAIGGWFVPPGFIYAVPWLIFNELWRGSDPANTPGDPNWRARKVSPLTTVWWILYGFVPLIGVAVGFGIAFTNFGDPDLRDFAESLDDFFVLQFVLGIVSIITAGVYAKLVHDLTRRQQALIGER